MKKQTKKSYYLDENPDEPLKKKALGQHFLRKQSTVDNMISSTSITPQTTILEIGCGDGFLTKAILAQSPCKKLIVYEIDPEWAEVVEKNVSDKRLDLRLQNVLEADWKVLQGETPLTILANLPYQITFPIFFKILQHKELFSEGIVMVQEEVAQKIASTSGKKYGPTSLLLQYHFHLKLLEKVEPGAFTPPPKVHSRLLYFKPKTDLPPLHNSENFWKFVKTIFLSPRQTLKNNLKRTYYEWSRLDEKMLMLRAQQMSFAQLIELWKLLDT
jgi:16S rRNA (adenine1518-N6/adenine1519-N6)-dimethyltransferase